MVRRIIGLPVRAVRWIDRHPVLFVIAGLLILVALALEQKHQSVTQTTLRTAQLRGCHRLNIDRARENRSWLHVYEADLAVLDYDRTFQSLVLLSLKHPATASSVSQRRNTKLFLRKLNAEIEGIEANITAVEWTPLTRCYPATDHPSTYIAPEAQPLSTAGIHNDQRGIEVLPPALEQALYVGPGE